MKDTNTVSKNRSRTLLSVLVPIFLFVCSPSGFTQKVEKLEQAANGKFSAINDPVEWVTGNVNEAKSHYAECMSIPYHLELSGLVAGETYCVTIGYDTKKNGTNAIDFLTSYYSDIAGSHNTFFGHTHDEPGVVGPDEEIDPTDYTALEDIGGFVTNTISIPDPDFNVQIPTGPIATSNGWMSAKPYYQSLDAADKLLTIFNGTFMGDPCYVGEDDLDPGATTSAHLRVCFKVDPDAPAGAEGVVVLAWGGHIASEQLWGTGTSATNITGSPYHTFLSVCNNDELADAQNPQCVPADNPATADVIGCGNKEVQLQAGAVAGGACTILGATPFCLPNNNVGETYAVILSDPPDPGSWYEWTISNASGGNNPMASFDSEGSGITVEEGTDLDMVTIYAIMDGFFDLQLIVYEDDTKNIIVQTGCSKRIFVENATIPVITTSPISCYDPNNPQPVITFMSDNASAANDDGELGVFTINPVPAAGWDPGGLQNPGNPKNDDFNQATLDPNLSGPGTFTITYQFTNEVGCVGEDSETIMIIPCCTDPVVTTVNSCIGGGTVTFTQTGGTPGGTWSVSGGGTIDPNTG
ncbi:MAG: hypothetical protein OEM26_05470, partial [Saprospiraceae bacterium]|nr:hypothetical protein [Saprospiraceae bacterium]